MGSPSELTSLTARLWYRAQMWSTSSLKCRYTYSVKITRLVKSEKLKERKEKSLNVAGFRF